MILLRLSLVALFTMLAVQTPAVEREAEPYQRSTERGGVIEIQVVGHEQRLAKVALDIEFLMEVSLGEREMVAAQQRVDRSGRVEDDARALRVVADRDHIAVRGLDGEVRAGGGHARRDRGQL